MSKSIYIPQYIPYTYLIGWSKHNTYYYGVRYKKGCNPADFWISYYTSSKYVKSFRDLHGEPDIIEIRKTFHSAAEARLWEHKVNKRLTVKSKKFLNKHDASENLNTHNLVPAINIITGEKELITCEKYNELKGSVYKTSSSGKPIPESTKEALRKKKGFVYCYDTILKCKTKVTKEEFKNNKDRYTVPSRGRKLSKEHAEALHNSRRNKKESLETRIKKSKALKGRKLSDSHKALMKEKLSGDNNPMKNKTAVFDLLEQKKKTIPIELYRQFPERYISVHSKRYKKEIKPYL